MPVLYGILLYMGVASLRGMQFIDRVGLLFMPAKYQPDHIYLRHVPLNKVHLFTIIQVGGKKRRKNRGKAGPMHVSGRLMSCLSSLQGTREIRRHCLTPRTVKIKIGATYSYLKSPSVA